MKGPDAFRTISEAASELGVPQHVLRFWETKFSFIRPMKRAGGRRFYRRQDIDVLRGVRALLHEEGYTIKGVQRLHKEQGMRRVLAAAGLAEALDRPAPRGEGAFGEADGEPGGDAAVAGDLETGAGDLVGDEDPFVRPLLGAAARRRLGAVLGDLEGVKARLDALLTGGNS